MAICVGLKILLFNIKHNPNQNKNDLSVRGKLT